MSDPKSYVPWAVLFAGTSLPFAADSIGDEPGLEEEEMMSGAQLAAQDFCNTLELPQIKMDLFDPDYITAVTSFGAGKSINGAISAHWRQKAAGEGYANAYISKSLAQGFVQPVSLKAEGTKPAKLSVIVFGLWSGGTCYTQGTASAAAATPVYYRLQSVSVGGVVLANPESLSVTYKYDDRFLPPTQVQPQELTFSKVGHEGDIVLQDLAAVTAARIKGSSETVSATFVNTQNDADTVTMNLGTNRIHVSVSGAKPTIKFKKKLTS